MANAVNYGDMVCVCTRCLHRWIKRIFGRPVRCPECKSPYWDKPRERDSE